MVHPFKLGRNKPSIPRPAEVDPSSDPADFHVAVETVRKRYGCSRIEAMRAARQQYGHLLKRYQDDGRQVADDFRKSLHELVEKVAHPDIEMFESLVTAFQKERGCPRIVALTRVARDHPTFLEKYRKAQLNDD